LRALALGGAGWSRVGLLWQQNGLDVRQDAALGDGDTRQELVQLLVVSDGQLQVSRDDSGLLVVSGSVAGQLEDFSAQVFKHGSQIDWSSSTNTLRVVALPQKSVHTTNWKLKASSR